jgi:hypothetical protein
MNKVSQLVGFLIDCRLIHGEYDVRPSHDHHVVDIQPFGDISKLVLHVRDDLVEDIARPAPSHAVVYLLPTAEHIANSMRLNRTDLLSCMYKNVLFVHYTGISRLISDYTGYGLRCMAATGDDDADKSLVLQMCYSGDMEYITMLSCSGHSLQSDILKNLYSYDCVDILDTFGSDYLFCLYYTQKAYEVVPDRSLYIIRESDAAHIIRIKHVKWWTDRNIPKRL